MTPCDVSNPEPGRLLFRDPDAKAGVVVRYEPSSLAVEIETIEMEDEKLTEVWGARLRRILLKTEAAASQETWTIRLSKEPP
jgi:hypothetical protein